MARKRTDPELLRQLDEARTTGGTVAAVVQLRRQSGKAPEPTQVEEQARQAVARTTQATGEEPADLHVMGRMAVAYVSGSERFVRELVGQPEVASAVANQASDPADA